VVKRLHLALRDDNRVGLASQHSKEVSARTRRISAHSLPHEVHRLFIGTFLLILQRYLIEHLAPYTLILEDALSLSQL